MPSSNLSDPDASRPDRGGPLNSWKEIAAYLNRSVVTVRRWEKNEALPVHRDKKAKSVAVRAYQSELDQWSRTRENEKQAEAGSAPRVPVEAESGPETVLAEPPDPEQAAEAEPGAPADIRSSGRQPSISASGPSLSDPPAGERLASWKQIAAYLDRGVGKVKGLAKQEGLPVHRNAKTKRAAIWAYTSELDAWLRETESGPPAGAIAEREMQDQPLPLADRASQTISETETLLAVEASAESERQPVAEPEPKSPEEPQAPAGSEILGEAEVAAEITPEFLSETAGPAAAESPDPPRPATVSEVEAPPEPEPPELELADEPVHEMEAADAEEAAVQAPAETEISVSGGVAQQPPAEPVVPKAAAAPEAFVPAPGAPPSEDLLNSWKEIAAYFDCSVGTVRRWEKRKGLPVHRDERKSPVWIYAYRSELEQWGQAGAGVPSGEGFRPLTPPPLQPLAPGRLETAPEQATAPLELPTAEVELPPVDDTTQATVSIAKSSEADSAGEMPPLVLAQAGLTVFGGMLLVIYLIGTLVNGKVLAQVLSAGVLMIFPLAIAPIVIGSLIIRRSEKSGHRPPGFVWAQVGMYVGLTLAVITTLIVAFAAAVEMMQLIAALLIPQMPRFL